MVILSFLSIEAISNLGSVIKKLFIGPEAQFVWITLPILTMVLMRKRRNKDKD